MSLLLLLALAALAGGLWYLSGRAQARALDFPTPVAEVAGEADAYPFLAVYFTLLIKVAQVDGHLDPDELAFARRHLLRTARVRAQHPLSDADLNRLETAILERGHELSLDEAAHLVRQEWDALGRPDPAAFYPEAITALTSLAAADGTLRRDEDATVALIASGFGLSEPTYAALRDTVVRALNPAVEAAPPEAVPPEAADAPFDPKQATDAECLRHYGSLLGLQGRLTRVEIRRRYRSLLAQYHPDKVAALGPELRALAEQKTKELNEAYAWIAARFNL